MKLLNYKRDLAVLGIVTLLISSYSCSNPPSTTESSIPVNTDVTSEVEVIPKNFTHQQIAKFAIATIMNQPEDLVKVSNMGDNYLVSYKRESDSENFQYKVRFAGNRIIWGNNNGRWRDSEYDEKISFREEGNTLTVVQKFSDGSETLNEFHKK